jgi:hypothetical protein
MRKDWGHTTSIALVSPPAPSVVIVIGVRIPRLTNSRNTSTQLSYLSLLVVERLTQTFRPSSQSAQTQRIPVFCPQRRKGS